MSGDLTAAVEDIVASLRRSAVADDVAEPMAAATAAPVAADVAAPVADGHAGGLVRYWTDTGLDLPPGLSFDEWAAFGNVLVELERSVMWALGDWWLAGERRYGETAAQAAPTGFSGETCRKAAWVAERFEPVRRRTDLTFGHHDAVASLDPADADALLDRAEADCLTVGQLRDARRHLRAVPTTATAATDRPDGHTVAAATDAATPASSPGFAKTAAGAAQTPEASADRCACCGRPFEAGEAGG